MSPSRISRLLAAATAAAALSLLAAAPTASAHVPNPLAGPAFWADTQAKARASKDIWATIADWRSTRPADADLIERKIARQSQGLWFGNWNGAPEKMSRQVATWSAEEGQRGMLVTYALSNRVCNGSNSYFTGGFLIGGRNGREDGPKYRWWISEFAKGIGNAFRNTGGRARVAVFLEPDAIPDARCMSSTQRSYRLSLLKYAVDRLQEQPGAAVYIDAGRSGWGDRSPGLIASYLRGAGVHRSDGFALNVTGFNWTGHERNFGLSISNYLSGKHFVINTSRNGRGPIPYQQWRTPKDAWCNPPGRGLGARPTTNTGHHRVDAYVWVQRPGVSDTSCSPGQPPAGTFWPDEALRLATRASW